jgi:hypothetical protein
MLKLGLDTDTWILAICVKCPASASFIVTDRTEMGEDSW